MFQSTLLWSALQCSVVWVSLHASPALDRSRRKQHWQLWSAGFDLHRPISSMKHSGPSFPAKCLTPLTTQKSAHTCFGRVFSRTDVQTVLICRIHPSLPPVEEPSPSLPLGNAPCPRAAGAVLTSQVVCTSKHWPGRKEQSFKLHPRHSFSLLRSKMLSKTPVNMRQQEQNTWKGNSSSLLSPDRAGNHDSLQPDPTPRGDVRDLQVPISTMSPTGIFSQGQVLITRANATVRAWKEDLSITPRSNKNQTTKITLRCTGEKNQIKGNNRFLHSTLNCWQQVLNYLN